jgi:Ser/Thr protein kinase RdoA (MazF antagonist)
MHNLIPRIELDRSLQLKLPSSIRASEHSLVSAAERFFGTSIQGGDWLEGGDEAGVLRAEAEGVLFVLHISPSWRTREELEWVHGLVRYAHSHVRQAVAPVERKGLTILEWEGRHVGLFPFVEGQALDRDNSTLRMEAARILAAIHKSLLDWPGGSRPEHGRRRVLPSPTTDLIDTDLDAWWMSARRQPFMIAPTHGDYYRRNLLCSSGRVVGVIDWHDAMVKPLVIELASATFELCRNDEHALQFDRADQFVATYSAAGGPIPPNEIRMLLPLIRLWLRSDALSSIAYDEDSGGDYARKQIRAFHDLSCCDWVPTNV